MDTENLVLVDKPVGISSFDVVRILRKKLDIRKIGHAGTLDPRASGLMILGVGPGTKRLSELIGLSKVYETEIIIGRSTTTGDTEGDIIEEVSMEGVVLEKEAVVQVLEVMIGTLSIMPPIYSAIKKDGKRLYDYARKGKEVTVEPRDMKVISFSDVEIDGATIRLKWEVGSGTYIRSLAEELGRRLGYPASLTGLRRISIGDFLIKDAISIEKESEGFRKLC